MEKKKILLIDDESDFCFFVSNNLEKTGRYQVTAATAGDEGIKLAKKNNPDLILLDIMMPKVSGPDVAEALMKDPLTKGIPVLFLTALVTEAEIGDDRIMKEIGGRSFIAKPIEIEELVNSIERTLR